MSSRQILLGVGLVALFGLLIYFLVYRNGNKPNGGSSQPSQGIVVNPTSHPPQTPGGKPAQELNEAQANALLSGQGEFSGDVMLMVHSPHCGHCQAAKPAYMAAASRSRLPFVHVDGSKLPNIVKKLGISGVPFYVLLRSGAIAKEYNGDRSEASLLQFTNEPQVGPAYV